MGDSEKVKDLINNNIRVLILRRKLYHNNDEEQNKINRQLTYLYELKWKLLKEV